MRMTSPSASGLAADPAAVDERAVGGAEVLDGRGAAVEDDVDVLAADAGVGQPDVGLGAAADHVAPGRQLVPGARAVDDEDVRDAGARAGAAGEGGALLAGVGGDAAAQRGERRQRRVAGLGRRRRGDRERPRGTAGAGGVGDLRADLEDAGGQVVVALEPHGHLVEDLVALVVDVLGDHVGELVGQLVGPLAEVVEVGRAEA